MVMLPRGSRFAAAVVLILLSAGCGGTGQADDRVDDIPSTTTPAPALQVGEDLRAMTAAGGDLWVADGSGALTRIDPAAATADDPIPVGSPVRALVASDREVWVAIPGHIQVVDTSSGDVTAELEVGPAPGAMVVRGSDLWVADVEDGSVSRIDIGSRTVQVVADPGGTVRAIAASEDSIWVVGLDMDSITEGESVMGRLLRLDPVTGEVEASHTTPGSPRGLYLDGSTGWITTTDGTLVAVDLGSGEITSTTRVGSSARGLDGVVGSIWVADPSERRVHGIDPRTRSVERSVSVTGTPDSLVMVDGAPWVTTLEGLVMRIETGDG